MAIGWVSKFFSPGSLVCSPHTNQHFQIQNQGYLDVEDLPWKPTVSVMRLSSLNISFLNWTNISASTAHPSSTSSPDIEHSSTNIFSSYRFITYLMLVCLQRDVSHHKLTQQPGYYDVPTQKKKEDSCIFWAVVKFDFTQRTPTLFNFVSAALSWNKKVTK